MQCIYRPRGKETTEVRKSQIKGKESENSYQELKRLQKGQAHTNTRKLNRDPGIEEITKGTGTHKHTETESRYFDWHGRLPQLKESNSLSIEEDSRAS